MAHFAKLGINSKVIAVHVLDNAKLLNADGVEDEAVGQQELEKIHGWPSDLWIKTSYNTRGGKHYDADGTESSDQSKALRGNYAGIGYTWDEDDQIFWPQKPYASWVKNNLEVRWQSPIGDAPELTTEQISQNEATTHVWCYFWNETNTTWDLTDGLA